MNTREDGKAFRDLERARDPLMGQDEEKEEKSGSVRCPWWHVNAQKILFMRDARVVTRRNGILEAGRTSG